MSGVPSRTIPKQQLLKNLDGIIYPVHQVNVGRAVHIGQSIKTLTEVFEGVDLRTKYEHFSMLSMDLQDELDLLEKTITCIDTMCDAPTSTEMANIDGEARRLREEVEMQEFAPTETQTAQYYKLLGRFYIETSRDKVDDAWQELITLMQKLLSVAEKAWPDCAEEIGDFFHEITHHCRIQGPMSDGHLILDSCILTNANWDMMQD